MSYLHWVGNTHYSIPLFIREAKKLGISRRINPKILKGMRWGDKIYLASRETGHKRPCIFGYFYLTQIKGIDRESISPEMFTKEWYTSYGPPQLERRRCGTQVSGGLYITTSAEVEELADYCIQDQVAIEGKLYLLPKPYPTLKNLVPFRGYRPFDEDKFQEDLLTVSNSSNGKRPVLSSLYY